MKGAALLCQLTWHGRHGHGHGRAKSLRERERERRRRGKFFVFNCSTVTVIVTNIFLTTTTPEDLKHDLCNESMHNATATCNH